MTIRNYSLWLVPCVWTLRMCRCAFGIILRLKSNALAMLWRVKHGDHVVFAGKTIIRAYERNAIDIGSNVTFNSIQQANLVGLIGPTVICANKGATIKIGDYSGFSSVVINARKSITIGNHVRIGGNVRIFDHDFHPLEWNDRRFPERSDKTRIGPVIIEDDVFIGTNAIILKGTHIGARSVVSAGSVVFGLKVPPDSLVKGNPAKVLRNLVGHDA